jgi:hypothetical protein
MLWLTRIEAAVSVMQVEASIRKILSKFFKEYDLPMPKIKIANSLSSRWLGRTTYKTNDSTTLIEVQRSITDDEKTLDRILTHELIHHWEFLVIRNPQADTTQSLIKHAKAKYSATYNSHGRAFQDWCTKINAVMGKDYVTEKTDSTYVLTLDKEFFILVLPSAVHQDAYAWSWAIRPSARQWAYIKRMEVNYKAKLYKTADSRFLSGNKLGTSAFSLANRGTEEGKILNTYLKEMYNSKKPITVG